MVVQSPMHKHISDYVSIMIPGGGVSLEKKPRQISLFRCVFTSSTRENTPKK